MSLLSRKQLCDEWGITRQTLQRYLKLGMPVFSVDGTAYIYDLNQVNAWRDASIQKRREPSEPSGMMPSKEDSDAEKTYWQAQAAKLKFEKESKQLIRIGFVIDLIRPILNNTISKVRELPARVAQRTADMTEYEEVETETRKLVEESLFEALKSIKYLTQKLKSEHDFGDDVDVDVEETEQ